MKTSSPITGNPNSQTAPGGTVELVTSRPTCAGPIPLAFVRTFQPAEGNAIPEFCKLPAPRARCPYTGASRTWLLEHAELGHFKILRVRKPGAMRGALFVHVPGLLEFLRREMQAQTAEQTQQVAEVVQ